MGYDTPLRMVRLAGLEPTASAFAGLRSIQLSYKRVIQKWCRGRDLNPHGRKAHYALNVARLPFRHPGSWWAALDLNQ